MGQHTMAEIVVAQPNLNVVEGYDVVWPKGPKENTAFAKTVAETITEKGYCVVQMNMSPADVAEARNTSSQLKWGILDEETEEDYLGYDLVDGKVAWLQYEYGEPAMRIYDIEDLQPDLRTDGMGALEGCDKTLTNIAALLWPLCCNFEDDRNFNIWGRTSSLLRASMEPGDEGVRKNLLFRGDQDEQDMHLNFMDSKKLCLMYFIDNDGGELELTPYPEAYDYLDARILLSKNKVVIFRCDSIGLSYSYKPVGSNMALQTWLLDTPLPLKEQEEVLRIIDGPPEPMGTRNNVMAVHTRYPGCGFEAQAFWNMLVSGGDTQIQVPINRWDIDIYYRKEHTIGFSMTCHGAMVTQAEVEQFDNKFFGISNEEAETIAPYMRMCLEVGYECMWRAGHRREEMKGFHCGVFFGDSGSDWEHIWWPNAKQLPYFLSSKERSAACTRLSHIMGLVGPCATAETACSSSLVACGVAQMTMRGKLKEQTPVHITTDLKHGLVVGSNTLIGPGSYISLSGPGMLTTHGRCFTFDHSADGFARGEGIGAIKLKVCSNETESVDRVAILIGCAVNQDGRSASMTAPHGPSQQEVIRASMREAAISPNLITIAECHGTGTALGDPIEIGALRGVLRADRTLPIMMTSAKANIGHLEAAAGIAGLIKCICMLNYSMGAPNVHLQVLNPHLDVQGFPVYFETELTDYGTNSGLTGVSSFGFGGTNARADVWGHSHHGHRMCVTGILQKTRSVLL